MIKFRIYDKHHRSDTVTLIPRDKIPKRITGRPRHKIDHYNFEGDFEIKILNIRTKGIKLKGGDQMARNNVIHIRLSNEELAAIKEQAKQLGLNDSSYVRMVLVTNKK